MYLSRGAKDNTNLGEMGSITPTPMAGERAVLTQDEVLKAARATVKWAENAGTNGRKIGSIYPSRGAKGDTNRRQMGRITPRPTAQNREVFTLGVVLKAASTAVRWIAQSLHPHPGNRQYLTQP